MSFPRVIIAGTGSSSGKTTATCAVLELLKRRGLDVHALKCGPDYIDPMFHREVSGIPSANLDPFFCDKDLLCHLLSENRGNDLTVIEGVMGYYDGTGTDGTENSTYTVAKETATPVILTVDSKGASASLTALIEGFVNFKNDSRIKGILFNRMSPSSYKLACEQLKNRFCDKIIPVGFIPPFDEKYRIPSRHLGLVTAGDVSGLKEKLDAVADICENTIDIDALISISKTAGEIPDHTQKITKKQPVNIAYAYDSAFCFYYFDTLKLFEKMGAELFPFSPLKNEPVPDCADGLLLGGGYPELHAEELENNEITKESIRKSVLSGMPVIAECGGFQYLGEELDGRKMCDVLPQKSMPEGKLVRFGYITLTSQKNGIFGETGTVLKGHEFHYWDSTENGDSFTAVKPNGKSWLEGFTNETIYAGYPHIFLYSNLKAAESFYDKCLKFKENRT